MQTFKNLGLSAELVKALTEAGITTPTAIQEQAIPTLLERETDFIGLAQTGTGKTAAFGLPLLDQVNEEIRATQCLIVAPTRELAVQTADNLRSFARYKKRVSIDVVYGGTPIMPHVRQLKKSAPMVLVATPGRLIDLVERGAVHLDQVFTVVLDEADEILNMGFKEDLDKILSFTPEDKQTWLFSATMPAGIRRIIKNYMQDPAEVSVSKEERVNKNIVHEYVMVRRGDRYEALKRIIDAAPEFYGLVFCRTKIEAQEIAEKLMAESYPADALHGDLSQKQRNDTMKRFKAGILKVVVATDVAARGIDVDNLTHVIHYVLPDDPAFYTHRSGRTARAGKKGHSIIMMSPGGERKLNSMSRDLGIKISRMDIPSQDQILINKISSWAARVMETEAGQVPEKLVNHCMEILTDVDKKDLLGRLLSMELRQLQQNSQDLNIQGKSKRSDDKYNDRRSTDKWSKDKRSGDKWSKDKRSNDKWSKDKRSNDKPSFERKEKSSSKKSADSAQDKPRNKKDFHRFFINLGSFDKIDKGNLLNLICSKTKLPEKKIGNIELGQKHAYFEIMKDDAAKVTSSFRNFSYRGRKIRVNRDAGNQ